MPVDKPHFKVPFTLGISGSFSVVQQDGLDDQTQRVEALIRTPIGTRLELPEYGIAELVLREGPPNVSQIERSLAKWEPEIRADFTTFSTSDPRSFQIVADIIGEENE